jgi:hypothetical protein
VRNGFLHALQHDERNIDLMFGPYGPTGTGGPMKARRFHGRTELADFLENRLGLTDNARKDLLGQLDSKRSGTLPDVWLSNEQLSDLGL